MIIIKNNYIAPGPEFPKEVFCQWCSSIIKIDAVDIFTKQVKNLTDVTNPYNAKGFDCPCCGKVVIIG